MNTEKFFVCKVTRLNYIDSAILVEITVGMYQLTRISMTSLINVYRSKNVHNVCKKLKLFHTTDKKHR